MNNSITTDMSLLQPDSIKSRISAPFFSIGVTTYNRKEFLKQALDSIIGQTFPDFEVVVGNNYTEEILSAEIVGIEDQRVQFVNHSQNLMQVGNMNSLLKTAKGRYFTWLCDDDILSPNFLEVLHDNLVKFGFPPAGFTAYGIFRDASFPAFVAEPVTQGRNFTGPQFLHTYLQGKLKTILTYGVFETQAFCRLWDETSLHDNNVTLYGEYLLLMRIGLLKNVVHIDSPLVHYRSHPDSYGWKATVEMHSEEGKRIIREDIQVLSKPELAGDFTENLLSLLNLVVTAYAEKLPRDADYGIVKDYLFSLRAEFFPLKGTIYYWKAMLCLVLIAMHYVDDDDKKIYKDLPVRVIRFSIWFRSFFPKPQRFWG